MANKLTNKQENFCQAYIETGNASEAYRQAYDVGEKTKEQTVWRKAKELMDNGKVTARIEALQSKHRERHDVTVDSLTNELEQARATAYRHGHGAAMVSASMGKAKLHGLIKDKHEFTGKDGAPLQKPTISAADALKMMNDFHRDHPPQSD